MIKPLKCWAKKYYFVVMLVLVMLDSIVSVRAGIMPESTRIIYEEGATEKSLMLVNTNPYPIMVQTWIDNGEIDSTPEQATAPFISLPAVFRMQPSSVTGLRVIYNQQPLPKDRESVFWLNLYEVPPTKSEKTSNSPQMKMTMNTQMKIFYRPHSLKNKPQDWSDGLQFSLFRRNGHLIVRCSNPTPYFASFASVKLLIRDELHASEQKLDMMTPPFSQAEYEIKQSGTGSLPASANLQFMLIDDHGFNQAGSRMLSINSVEQ